jgi:hypothetical protein
MDRKTGVNYTYIELTSEHRDRTRFRHPSQFEVEVSATMRNNSAASSKDPTFSSVMLYPPPNLEIPVTYPTFGYMYGFQSDTSMGLLPVTVNINQEFEVLPLGTRKNEYVGDVLELVSNVVSNSTTTTHEYRIIVESTPFISESVATTVDGTEPINTTSISLNTTCDIDGFFNSWEIEFGSGDTRIVSYYRGIDRRIFFDTPTDGIPISGGDIVYIKLNGYKVRIDTPFSIGVLPDLSNSCDTANYSTYRIRSGVGQPLQVGTLVDGSTRTFELPPSVGIQDFTGSCLWITKDPIVYNGTFTSTTLNTFVSTGAGLFADDYLNNMTITITSGAFSGHSWIISDWVQSTQTGTISRPWSEATSPSGGDTFTITQPNPSNYKIIVEYNPSTRIGLIGRPFTYKNVYGSTTQYSVTANDTFEILQFSTDNYSPLNYADSSVSTQQVVCYELTLISLTIPNIPIKTGRGSRISSYPYVYVELRSITQGASANDFNTNNPTISKTVMFRAPIVYNYNIDTASFITVDGHGMIQTLKFKPNDSFRFSVYLPNGELIITEEDYFSPSAPNPWVQISACIRMRRLNGL